MKIRKRRPDEPEVAMSPLIDAVFLLLIFFLVATMFKKEKRDIDIVPPESGSAVKMKPDDDVLVLGVTPAGEVFWQGQPITRTDLHNQLRDLSLNDPGRQIRFDADAATPYYHVVQVLDHLQFLGFDNVGIRTYDDRYNR